MGFFCMKGLERLQTSDGKTTGVTGAAKVLGALMHRAWFGFVCAYRGATKLHKQSVFPKHIRFRLVSQRAGNFGEHKHGRMGDFGERCAKECFKKKKWQQVGKAALVCTCGRSVPSPSPSDRVDSGDTVTFVKTRPRDGNTEVATRTSPHAHARVFPFQQDGSDFVI